MKTANLRSALPLLLLLSPLPAPPGVAIANPVPDHVARDFQVLVATTAATGVCSAPDRLADHFGRFGLDLLRPSDLEAIATHFSLFAPILVRAQEPGHRLSEDILTAFLDHGEAAERGQLAGALRRWMTTELDKAPPDGSMQILYPPDQLVNVIDRARAVAAGMLADLGDTGAGSLISALLERSDLDGENRAHLEMALRRFDDPCAGQILRRDLEGRIIVCVSPESVASASIRGHQLDRGEIAELWRLLATVRLQGPPGVGGYGSGLMIELDDGTRAELRLRSDSASIEFADRSSLSRRRGLHLSSPELHQWIDRAGRSEHRIADAG